MSASDPRPPAIPLDIATDPDAWITIFDGFDAMVLPPRPGDQIIPLRPGIYTIRCERAGQATQDLIRHTAARRLSIQPPPVASAAPIEGAVTSHEYYHGPSQEWSTKPTAVLAPYSGPGWIFVFIRAWDQQSYAKGTNLGSGFELVDVSTGERFARLADHHLTARDEHYGWLAFSASMKPGYYALRYMDSERWAMPVHVFPGRSTQVFVLFHSKPLTDSVRVFYRRLGEPFRAQDINAIDVDFALTGLASGAEAAERAIPRHREAELLIGKFEDPMFGLLGAHWLLSRPDAQSQYVDVVLNNLRLLLPGSPDVAALEILAAARWSRALPPPTAFPPMLSAGLRALRSNPDQHIVPGSFLEQILVRLRAGSPWVFWGLEAPVQFSFQAESRWPADDQWVQRVLLHALPNLDDPSTSLDERTATLKRISSELHLPFGVIWRASENLRRSANDEPVRFEIPGARAPDGAAVHIDVGNPENWIWRAALLLDEPCPPVNSSRLVSIPLTGTLADPVLLPGRNPVAFESRSGQGSCAVFQDRHLLLNQIDGTGVLGAAIPTEKSAGQYLMLFRWNYDVTRVQPGDLCLGTEGPAYRAPVSNYALACPFPEYWGAGFAFESALKHWRVPIQIRSVDDLLPGELICCDVAGSFQLRFRALARLNVINAAEERAESARAAIAVTASVGGVFRVVLSRQSPDAQRQALQFRVFQSSGVAAPVVSVQARSVGRAGESVWSGGEEIHATSWPRIREEAARAAARTYSQALAARLSGLVQVPLIECELDFAADRERVAGLLRDLLEGVFDRSATEITGDLVTITEHGPAIDVRASSGDASLVELGLDGDITIRLPEKDRPVLMAEELCGRIGREPTRPLQTTLSAAIPAASPAFLRFYLHPLLKRFRLAGSADSAQESLEGILSGWMAAGANATMAVEIKWPLGIESSWLRIEPSQVAGLKARLGAELRFWARMLALDDAKMLGDFNYASAFLAYGALPPGFDPRTESMALSPTILRELNDSLIHLVRAGYDLYSIRDYLEQAENSTLFRMLLEFEDSIFEAVDRAVQNRDLLVDVLSPLGTELSFSAPILSQALQTLLFGAGALQLAGDPNLTVSAAVRLNLLRRGAPFPPAGFPLHSDPPLSDVIAQLRLWNFVDRGPRW
jgi:hypothetical protein